MYIENIMKVPKKDMVRIIITSGDSIEFQEKTYGKFGVHEYLQKPFPKDLLVDALHSLEGG